VIRRYLPNGQRRAIWDDRFACAERQAGVRIQRASRVEVIDSGPYAGYFYADLSLVAQAAGQPKWAVCLYPPQPTYQEAVASEVRWLKANFLELGERACEY